MNIGDRIEALRKKQGMTQEQLAQQIGATRQAVSKWESGKSYPDIDYAIRMGECFGVSMDYLLLGKGNRSQETLLQEKEERSNRYLYILSTVCGGSLTLLLPLIADLYRNYTFEIKGTAFTDAMEYLKRWPLLGVVVIAIGALLFGVKGLVQVHRKKKNLPPLSKAIRKAVADDFKDMFNIKE